MCSIEWRLNQGSGKEVHVHDFARVCLSVCLSVSNITQNEYLVLHRQKGTSTSTSELSFCIGKVSTTVLVKRTSRKLAEFLRR